MLQTESAKALRMHNKGIARSVLVIKYSTKAPASIFESTPPIILVNIATLL